MNIKWITLTVFLIASTEIKAIEPTFRYDIGGGLPINSWATQRPNVIKFGIGIQTNMACGANFDPIATVTNQLNGIEDGFKDMMGSVIQSATGYVASLPGMIIQRVNPGLYDMLQNGMAQGQIDFDLANATCEDFQDMFSTSPSSNGAGSSGGSVTTNSNSWVTKSKGNTWQQESSAATNTEPDPTIVKKDIEEDAGDKGVEWIDGITKGGVNQPPIEVIKDVTIAGYNMTLGRTAVTSGAVATVNERQNNRITKYWASPAQAQEWTEKVVGNIAIKTCKDCQKIDSTPGKGLLNSYEDEFETKTTELMGLVDGSTSITLESLKSISEEGLYIGETLIQALQYESNPEVYVRRLAAEIAMITTMERAMMMKRILKFGLKEPNVASNDQAVNIINSEIATLDSEMKDMLFEMDVRERISHNTAKKIIERYYEKVNGQEIWVEPAKSVPVEHGGIKN